MKPFEYKKIIYVTSDSFIYVIFTRDFYNIFHLRTPNKTLCPFKLDPGPQK